MGAEYMGVDPEPLQITKMNSTVFSAIFMVLLVASPLQAAPETQAVEDRTFCMAQAATTCANSCTGVSGDETCTVICGFWYFYRRPCSNANPTGCTTTTTTTATPTSYPPRLSYCFCCFLLQPV